MHRLTSSAILTLFAALSLGGLAEAQSTIISPVQAATREGNSNNAFPWNSSTVRRYQQIHSDIGGTAKTINKVSFRGNAGNTTTYTGTWACDLEMYMGDSRPWNTPSLVFAQNYLATPSLVFTRKVINLGPLGTNTTTGPNPFTIHVPLDTPFSYTGVNSMLWEGVVYSNTLTGTFNQLDAESGGASSSTQVITGTGCIATGRTLAMTHGTSAVDNSGTLLFGGFTVTNGPSAAPSIIAIGVSNPNVAVPGLCSNVLTDLLITMPIGTTSATGAITADHGIAFYFPNNPYGGATLYTQAHSLDLARPDPIGVSNSNGRQIPLPMPNLTNVVTVDRIYNNVGGTTATNAAVITSAISYAIVTQFTY